MAAAEETEIILDGKLLALGITDLTEFGLYLKVEKAMLEGQTKVKIIKVIRTELEKIINTFDYHLHSGKLEFLALKWAVTEHFRDYLYYASKFVVYIYG
jgi:UPF0288 family protein (methanogenesis marker protein 3)